MWTRNLSTPHFDQLLHVLHQQVSFLVHNLCRGLILRHLVYAPRNDQNPNTFSSKCRAYIQIGHTGILLNTAPGQGIDTGVSLLHVESGLKGMYLSYYWDHLMAIPWSRAY
jgi:hypothetical protein